MIHALFGWLLRSHPLKPKQDGLYLAGDIFKHVFIYENINLLIQIVLISLMASKQLINITLNNGPRRVGEKPLSKPMVT